MTTKEQERKALEQIRKIVAGLGEDSYIAMAFEGCFEIASENIENDFGCSMKDRAETAEKKLAALTAKYNEDMARMVACKEHLEKKVDEADQKIKNMEIKLAGANGTIKDYEKAAIEAEAQIKSARKDADMAGFEINRQAQEIMKLKAKLYDLITK